MIWIWAAFTQMSLSLSHKVINIRNYLFFCGNLNTDSFGHRVQQPVWADMLVLVWELCALIHQDFFLVALGLQTRSCVLQHLPRQTEAAKQ